MTEMLRRFDGKVVMVVGAATGIGAATARRLAAEGAKLVLADISPDKLEAVVKSLNTEVETAYGVACDISDESAVKAAVGAALAKFKALDSLYVNAADVAAAYHDTDATDVPLDIFDRTMSVNLRGHLLVTRYAVPAMLERGGGAIVYASSRAGITSESVRVSYAVSKSGLHALMRHVALAWGKRGIRANAVAPGTTLTEAMLRLGQAYIDERARVIPAPRLGRPEDIAAAVAFLLSDDAVYINGQVLSVDGGATMR